MKLQILKKCLWGHISKINMYLKKAAVDLIDKIMIAKINWKKILKENFKITKSYYILKLTLAISQKLFKLFKIKTVVYKFKLYIHMYLLLIFKYFSFLGLCCLQKLRI